MSGRPVTAAALLLVAFAAFAQPALAAGRAGSGRELLQSATSCPNQIPACRDRRCTVRTLGSKETYVCLRCKQGYVPVLGSDGRSIVQCVCPPGTYESAGACASCGTGNYCPGGNKKATGPNDDRGTQNSCGPTGLTTKTDKAAKYSDCVALPGYVLPKNKGDSATQCTGSTYAPANNKLKSCLKCQSGLESPPYWPTSTPKTDKNLVCQVPPGRFLETNVIRECPKGLYRENYVLITNKTAISCLSCKPGWTTVTIGTPDRDMCNQLLPGYKVVNVSAGNETANITWPVDGSGVDLPDTELCPFNFYYDGTPGIVSCKKCPFGSLTLQNGSTSLDDCQVPPGYFIKQNGTDGTLTKCPGNIGGNGYYRSNWVTYKQALETGDGTTACTACGSGILSEPVDADERTDIDTTNSLVPATPSSCYILAGWGITFVPDAVNTFRAIIPCPANTYGVANQTYGLVNAPCKACTKNLYSPANSTSFQACKNPAGFGYTSEGANQCPDGFWAAKDSMQPCEQCPPGRTTGYIIGNGTLQGSIDDCKVKDGYGVYDPTADDPFNPSNVTSNTTAAPCPVGYYFAGEGDGQTTNPKCQKCTGGQSTAGAGSTSCNACAAGYGSTNGSITGCATCNYDTYSAGGDLSACNACPNTTFNHPMGSKYVSYGVTFQKGVTGSQACVPKYSQLPNPAGHRLVLPDVMWNTPTNNYSDVDVAVSTCVESCSPDTCCVAEIELIGTDYVCKRSTLPAIGSKASTLDPLKARMYYKLPPSEIAAASVKLVKKTIASGIFAVCDVTDFVNELAAGLIGTSTDPTKVEQARNTIDWNTAACNSELSCQTACINDATCWGVVWHPSLGWAYRGGEDRLDTRTFFSSPDPTGALSSVMESFKWAAP